MNGILVSIVVNRWDFSSGSQSQLEKTHIHTHTHTWKRSLEYKINILKNTGIINNRHRWRQDDHLTLIPATLIEMFASPPSAAILYRSHLLISSLIKTRNFCLVCLKWPLLVFYRFQQQQKPVISLSLFFFYIIFRCNFLDMKKKL